MPDFTELLSNYWFLGIVGAALFFIRSPLQAKVPDWVKPILATLEKVLEDLQDKKKEAKLALSPDDGYEYVYEESPVEAAQAFYALLVSSGNAEAAKCVREHILPIFEAQAAEEAE